MLHDAEDVAVISRGTLSVLNMIFVVGSHGSTLTVWVSSMAISKDVWLKQNHDHIGQTCTITVEPCSFDGFGNKTPAFHGVDQQSIRVTSHLKQYVS